MYQVETAVYFVGNERVGRMVYERRRQIDLVGNGRRRLRGVGVLVVQIREKLNLVQIQVVVGRVWGGK